MRTDIDAAVAALAAGQWGVWTGAQAERVGASTSLASRRVLKGSWVRPHPNVYAHRAWVRTPEAEALAAAWSLRGGLASHATAAFLHGLAGATRGPVEVTVERGHYQPRRFVVHETRSFPDSDKSVARGVPCTSIERTIVDLGSRWSRGTLEDALDSAVVAQRATMERFERVALPSIGKGHAASDVLRSILEERDSSAPPPESTLERLLIEIIDAGGYGPMTRQMPIPSFTGLRGRVDGFLDHVGVIVEADGRRWHTRVRDFEADRHRDDEVQALGLHVARFTHRELVRERGWVIRILDQHFLRNGFTRSAAGPWLPAAA